jgi:hypothetical protein
MSKTINAYAAVLLFFCMACNSDVSTVDTPQRYEEFFVRYIAGQGQVKATAMFFEQDSVQKARPISMPQGVSFQNRRMTLKPLPGGAERFLIEQQSDYPQSFVFAFSDAQQQPARFEISMPAVKDFSIKDGKCHLADGLHIFMDAPLSAKESMVIFLTDEAKKASTYEVEGPSEEAAIHLSSDKIAGLVPGQYEMYLIKKAEEVKKEANCTTTGLIEYYSSAINVEIIE